MTDARDDSFQQPTDPYRSPTEAGEPGETRSILESGNIAAFLWAALGAKLVTARYSLGPMFEDFGIQLPILTQWLFHPLAPGLCFVAAAIVIFAVLVQQDQGKRKRIGRFALALALVAVGASLMGLFSPLATLMNDLSSN